MAGTVPITPALRAGVYRAVADELGEDVADTIAQTIDGGSPVARAVNQLREDLLDSLRELRESLRSDQQDLRKSIAADRASDREDARSEARSMRLMLTSIVLLAMAVNGAMVGVGISYGVGGQQVTTRPGVTLPAPGVPMRIEAELPAQDSDAWRPDDDGASSARDTHGWSMSPEAD